MFYAQFVLSKKGPLAKIWLAAHWEKKLSKQQIFETNVVNACDEILKPKVKMALRTTGHLLLGIVRIYSRKAKYLLADCNEAFLKIKMAFRPGQVDLPEESREANANAITLPEVFHDFDSALPDFNDLDIQQQLSLNQSRIDDITLKEDEMPHNSYAMDFMSDDFGEAAATTSGHGHAMGGLHDDFGDSLQMERAGSRASVAPSMADSHRDSLLAEPMFAMDQEMFNEMASTHGGDMDSVMDIELDNDRPATVLPPGAVDESGLPMHDEPASFALEPLDATVVQGIEKQRGRRKRKLIVDEVKNITGEEMKLQMQQTDDLVVGLELAPPTRRMMQLCEAGRCERLFQAAGSQSLVAQSLLTLYQSQTATTNCREDAESLTRAQRRAIVAELELASADQLLEMDRPGSAKGQLTAIREELTAPGMDAEELEEDYPEAALGEAEEAAAELTDDDQPLGAMSPTQRSKKDKKKSAVHDKTVNTTLMDETLDDCDEPDDKRFTKRTQHILNAIKNKLTDGQCTFSDISKGATRKSAAQKFHTLLVLKKWQAIDVSQDEPLGDIVVRPGLKINEYD